jgi:penicillin-binding protein 1A
MEDIGGSKRVKKFFEKYKRKIVITLAVAGVIVIAAGIYIASGLPSLEELENPRPELATRLISIDGEVIDQYFIKNRTRVTIDKIPLTIINALIATEDKNFFDHWGVDAVRFMQAQIKNLLSLRMREGASTITQQLARNLYELRAHQENILDKIVRKIREVITAVQIERTYTKKEILELYLNVTYFGRSAYGISAASEIYFGKEPAQLSLPECATLVALLKGPAVYDPFNHPERAYTRRNVVLSQMLKYNFITQGRFDSTRTMEMKLRSADEFNTGIAPQFVEMIRQQLSKDEKLRGYDMYRDGLTIYTTLDSRMQRYANQAVREHLLEYQKLFDSQWKWTNNADVLAKEVEKAIKSSDAYQRAETVDARKAVLQRLKTNQAFIDSVRKVAQTLEVGFVALDPRNGNILAMVGGNPYKNIKYGLNHVTQIHRQPGSTFKPFVYTVAIDNNYSPSFEILNQPVTVMLADGTRWTPSNADGSVGGKLTLREGLARSVNLITARLITQEIAPAKTVVEYAHRMGIRSELPPYESLAMGTGEVTPLEIVSAYGVFANDGVYVEPNSVLRIEDKDGNVIEENAAEMKEVLSKETAFLMTTMMEDVINFGTGAGVRRYFSYPSAGKTGTTQEYADAWFIGYTPNLVAGGWVGWDNKSIHFNNWDGQGARAVGPIWGMFMKNVYDDKDINMEVEYFLRPENIKADSICVLTKKKATEYCPEKTVEYFRKDHDPEPCDVHTNPFWNRKRDPSTITY